MPDLGTLTDEAILRLFPSSYPVQLDTVTPGELEELRSKFPLGDYAQIGELSHD